MSFLLLQSQPAMGAAFYAGLFSKYGATSGWFVHGGANRSKFYQDSAGTVLAASTGDPIGYAQDLSGLNNHPIQATTALKYKFNTDGTSRWYTLNAAGGVENWLKPAANIFPVAEYTKILAFRGSATAVNQAITNYNAGWPVDGIFATIRNAPETLTRSYVDSSGSYAHTGDPDLTFPPVIAVAQRKAGVLAIRVYSITGVLGAGASANYTSSNIPVTNPLALGNIGGTQIDVKTGVNGYIPAAISNADELAIVADIASTMTGWNP